MDVQDLLLSRVLAPSSGYLTSLQNVGTLTNKGIEVLLKGQPIFKKDFSWDVSVIYSHNRNKVNNIEGGSVPLPGGFDGLIIAKNDYPIGVFQPNLQFLSHNTLVLEILQNKSVHLWYNGFFYIVRFMF